MGDPKPQMGRFFLWGHISKTVQLNQQHSDQHLIQTTINC